MMLVTAGGREAMLAAVLGQTPISTTVLHLYSNNKTPADEDTVGDYEEAAAGFGYQSMTLSPGAWVITPDEAIYPEMTIEFLGAMGNVYGYYITDARTGDLLWAERFKPGPYNIANNGDRLRLIPRLELRPRQA